MPSQFLKDRHSKFFAEVSGRETVLFVPFDPAAIDNLTNEVIDETLAYPATAVGLPGLVEFSPSEKMRERFGLEVDFEATIRIPDTALRAETITLKIGDRFTLPDGRQYYVKKAIQNMQAGTNFLEWLVAVGAKVGRRG